jgi:hypothetical protein
VRSNLPSRGGDADIHNLAAFRAVKRPFAETPAAALRKRDGGGENKQEDNQEALAVHGFLLEESEVLTVADLLPDGSL